MPAKQPKKRRLWLADGSCARMRARHVNHVWVYDFVMTRTTDGRPGERDDGFDELLIHASRSLSDELLARLGEFDTNGLVPYEPGYLAGWHAEEYQIDLEQGWEIGRGEVEAIQRRRCASDVPGDTQRNLHVQNHITDVRWKHVLLPVWSLQYDFRNKTYTVLVNGQSGRIAGEAPLSGWKIAGLVLAIVVVILLALLAFAVV